MKRKREEAEQDPKLKEFLEVYQPPSKKSAWLDGVAQIDNTTATADDAVQAAAVPEDESDDEYQTITKTAKPALERKEQVDEALAPSEDRAIQTDEQETNTIEAMEDVQEAPVAEQGTVSDMDWLRSRTNRVLELVEDDEEPQAKAPAVRPPSPKLAPKQPTPTEVIVKPAEEQQPEGEQLDVAEEEEDKIRKTGRLYLRNLHFDVTEDELREQFSKHGALEEVSLIISFIFTTRNDERQDRDN